MADEWKTRGALPVGGQMMMGGAQRVDVCGTHRRFYEALKSFPSLGKTGGFRRAAPLRLGKQEG